MALRFAWAWNKTNDPAYLNDTNLWTLTGSINQFTPNNATVFSGPVGFSGYSFARSLRLNSYVNTLALDIPGAAISQGCWISRVYVAHTQWSSISDWIRLYSGGSTVVSVRNLTQYVALPLHGLYVNGVQVATFGPILLSRQYDIAIGWDGTTSTATVYLDGVAVATGSSGAAFSVTDFEVLARGNGGGANLYYDAWTIWDSASDDPSRTSIYVLPALPNADVSTTGWTSTGGNFYSQLSDGNDSTYAQSTTTPNTGNLQIGCQSRADIDAGFTGGTIYGVGLQASAKGDGALTSVEVGLDSGGSTATTSGYTTTTTGTWAYHLSLTDPNTAAAWTGAAFDAVTTLFEGS
jgi:hypothetical protein